MIILQVHNFYQSPGGEDQVFAHESALLQRFGHQVVKFTAHNADIQHLSTARLVHSTLWNSQIYSQLRKIIQRYRPHLVHFHNTFPLISPAAYYAAKSEQIPVIQTLHNYRLICPSAILFRHGRVCEECINKSFPWPAILHGCYQQRRSATTVTAGMLGLHRILSTWSSQVDAYIALTHFAKKKFIAGGIPKDKLFVKPNFLPVSPTEGVGERAYILFVGRLTDEKGLNILLEAWKNIRTTLQLKIIGDGPLASTLATQAKVLRGIEWLGQRDRDSVSTMMKNAFALIVPSLWYEGFPMVVAEAYSVGLPVISSAVGSLEEVVTHGVTGRHFRPGDSQDLQTQIEWAINHPESMIEMRKNARERFLSRYTAEENHRLLMEIYDHTLGETSQQTDSSPQHPQSNS
ncbi:MAG: glycosyltransferase [Nitrospiraceae bacterium]|nr:glycosyltransferase [Nitrospiraceae bacterium]